MYRHPTPKMKSPKSSGPAQRPTSTDKPSAIGRWPVMLWHRLNACNRLAEASIRPAINGSIKAPIRAATVMERWQSARMGQTQQHGPFHAKPTIASANQAVAQSPDHLITPSKPASFCVAAILLAIAGFACAANDQTLNIWNDAAEIELVSRFNVEQEGPTNQWFMRVLDTAALPADAIFPLSDRFDFVIIRHPRQWTQLLKAVDLSTEAPIPDFNNGVLVGLIARIGQTRSDRWPILVRSVRQRGRVAFLNAEFREGFYRPLSVPPYLHLVHVRGVDTFLGVKLNQMMYGFNVEIEDLNSAGIR